MNITLKQKHNKNKHKHENNSFYFILFTNICCTLLKQKYRKI